MFIDLSACPTHFDFHPFLSDSYRRPVPINFFVFSQMSAEIGLIYLDCHWFPSNSFGFLSMFSNAYVIPTGYDWISLISVRCIWVSWFAFDGFLCNSYWFLLKFSDLCQITTDFHRCSNIDVQCLGIPLFFMISIQCLCNYSDFLWLLNSPRLCWVSVEFCSIPIDWSWFSLTSVSFQLVFGYP